MKNFKVIILVLILVHGSLNIAVSQNHYLDFDGEDDFVQISNCSPIDFSNDFTIEIKFKRQKLNIREDILTKKDLNYNSPSTNDVALFTLEDNRIVFLLKKSISNQIHLISQFTTDTLSWVHIACVRTGNYVQLFINGYLEASGVFVEDVTSNGPLRIGSNRAELYHPYAIPMRPFDGGIDEVRIWNIGRSAIEIQNNMNIELEGNEYGLVSYYNFNQGTPCANNISVYTLIDGTFSNNTGFLTNFDLTATLSDPCESNWSIEQSISIDEIPFQSVQLSPNPIKNELTIQFDEEKYIEYIRIYNIIGELKKVSPIKNTISNYCIDLSDFQTGFYLVVISDKNLNQVSYKVMKK